MSIYQKITRIAAVLVPLYLLLLGTATLQKGMNRIRQEAELTDTAPLENAPPVIAFTTVALGSFRGLLANWLWLRSQKMHDTQNFFEMYQLASWIVKLQPRFTGASAFLAWNMAYNVSVTFRDPMDRWRWVQRGIALLRDEAMSYNRSDPDLYHELGWIFQHKMGQEMDDANRVYKTEWALEMMAVLGIGKVDWDALAAAPENFKEFADGLGRDAQLWRILEKQAMTFDEVEKHFRRHQGSLPEKLVPELEKQGLLAGLDAFLRANWLRQKYKLDPRLMRDLNQKWGEFDWRLPDAHAVYWGTRALEKAPDKKHLKADRMIFQGMNAAFKGGRLIYVKEARYLETAPNFNLIDGVIRIYQESLDKHGQNRGGISGGYENFLVDAIVMLYTYGKTAKAQEVYKIGQDYNASRFDLQLDDFVLKELAIDTASFTYNQAQATVQGLLAQSFHSLAIGEEEQAVTMERMAKRLYDKYHQNAGISGRSAMRRGLPPFDGMKTTAGIRVIQAMPPALADRLRAALPALAEAERRETQKPPAASPEEQLELFRRGGAMPDRLEQ